ncbi:MULTISPECIES: sigma-70 family RNA polymerase sigma factor [unclassified Diaminobutyricimonas]|uniref:sigma-70 family RNA polymerase sigma factor n=1 Tax=unclassified Diaminobutyricimonas TaxID=2643261 RepID=UPI0012F5271B|nr:MULTISPECIES: sigma-70 family RNA polymerase sigma factor [unclassified Diaminobutyricimonas]
MPPDDESRLVELYDAHGPSVWRFVVHLTGSPTEADDIVQETLLRAWRSPQITNDQPALTRSWLLTVAHNLVIDNARSARRRHEIGVAETPERIREDSTDALFESLLVEEALATLDLEHRAVIVHAYYGGCSIAEVADRLGIPQGTVKSRLHYGLRTLRLALQEKGVTR